MRKVREIAAALLRKGFRETQGGRHRKFTFWYGNKITSVFTVISHGEKEIGDSLFSLMARQLKITKQDFERLIDCPLDEATYKSLLINKGILKPGRQD